VVNFYFGDVMILPSSFYSRPTRKVARDLIGQILTHETPEGIASGRIAEVEAYLPKNDPACHAARGQTPRNRVMFGPAGFAYVYFCYGNHFLLNVVTEQQGVPGAVLIRALEPLDGIDLMARRRKKEWGSRRSLTNGPGKLVQALGISRAQNERKLTVKPLYIRPDTGFTGKVGVTTRIGITEGWDLPLRFYLKGSPDLSVGPGKDRPSPGRKRALGKR
jgi:DNA-3-methyladenine glycosylase